MKVVLEPATGATMKGKTKDGKEIELESVAIVPFFASSMGPANVVLGKSVTKHGTAVDQFALRTNGSSGKIQKGERPKAKGAVPKIDQDPPK